MDVREQVPIDGDAWLRSVQAEHGPAVYRYLSGLTLGDRAAAEDLLQETLLRAWRHHPMLSRDPAGVRAWLFRVARNLVIDVGRARRIRPPEMSPPDLAQVPAAGDAMERVLTADVVREALRRLSPAHRAVLVELYFTESQAVDVAARLGVPEGTVKSRAHYALRALRDVMKAMES
ncbi:sigma-70 family RNA polymerase sigma factor [Actinoplanes derwentensis]|uniref:RNA polymerase sigma factor n=1 Tax=Actinoplanes derwentensis TaxID=113562 RepID=A0A1H2C8K1_9ACTN|nr:sigma-70 family RNA polymerase sigma factor [Actinoplanes derwentensis]GID86556.1 RNA polymerase sigma factor SigL [Actinoplanes derwentensis]SDT66396.1 RNA polymerase sigma-70 factor, ECF subfamily [Actinoplanes derwentensis]